MQKSLFRKYLGITSLVVLISFLALAVVMIVFVGRYWNSERVDLLQRNAEGVANVAAKSMLNEKNNTFTIDGERMEEFVSAFSENIDAYILVTDVKGNIIMSHNSERLDQSASNEKVKALDAEVIKTVISSGGYQGTTSLNGYFNKECVVVGVPIVITSGSGTKTVIGTAFAASASEILSGFRRELVKMFLLAAMAAFMVAFGVAWLFSYRITRPLRVMSDATKSFAMGDFSVRVPVYSNDEVGELAMAFNQMAETLASSEAMNRNFIANVSHELKTPMTTISGFVDGIIDGTIPPERQSYYLDIVSQEVKRLSRLVKTMLDLSRIDSGKMKLHKTRFDINNTIVMTLLSFESKIEEKKIDIRGLEDFEPLFVDGDPDMIHQVLYNLLENAVKFTEEEGYIEVHTVISSGKVIVSVRNSGPGIPPDDVKLIFDRFYKTDKSRSKDKTGMGLGLYIVKTMIQLHGGEIRVESVENDYTLFEFWIPSKSDKKEKKSVKTIIRNKEKPGSVEVVDTSGKAEDDTPEIVAEQVRIVDVTESAVETTPENDRKREGKRGK